MYLMFSFIHIIFQRMYSITQVRSFCRNTFCNVIMIISQFLICKYFHKAIETSLSNLNLSASIQLKFISNKNKIVKMRFKKMNRIFPPFHSFNNNNLTYLDSISDQKTYNQNLCYVIFNIFHFIYSFLCF